MDLPLEIQGQIDAAEGWLGLGDAGSASAELELIPAESRAHPKVLLVRLLLYSSVKKWEACVDIADAIVRLAPEMREGWINRSCALHKLRRTQEAYDLLQPAIELFKNDWVLPYDLALYCCQLGRIGEAEKWLGLAMSLDEDRAKRAAIDDPDLEPLWRSRSGSAWEAV